eukprot:tig00020965_g16839.t1
MDPTAFQAVPAPPAGSWRTGQRLDAPRRHVRLCAAPVARRRQRTAHGGREARPGVVEASTKPGAFQISVEELAKVTGGRIAQLGDASAKTVAAGVTTDTRELVPGNLFVALRGGSFDGNNFAAGAVKSRASIAVTEREVSSDDGSPVPQIVVPSTLRAYQAIGRWWRERFDIPVIGITGSVGKTTTKELVSAVLESLSGGSVLRSAANFNNEIGVPKTLLGLDSSHRFAVVEMGMRALGEIAELADVARPTVGVITNVGTMHIGRLGSRENIAIAKCELLEALDPASGVAVLSAEEEYLMRRAAEVWARDDPARTCLYGLEAGNLRGAFDEGAGTVEVEGVRLPMPLAGRHNAMNLLAAVGVARFAGLDWRGLADGRRVDVQVPGGRSGRSELPGGVLVLDESYNAGPESMAASLELLAGTAWEPAGRRIAVLGRMGELGVHALPLHEETGRKAAACGVEHLFVLQPDPEGREPADEGGALFSDETAALARGYGGPSDTFDNPEALVEALDGFLRPGDRVLFKASNSVGLFRVPLLLAKRRGA